jgi:four helix bundle protein
LAQSSLAELQTQIEIATRSGYRNSEPAQRLLEEAAALTRQLCALRNSLSRAE